MPPQTRGRPATRSPDRTLVGTKAPHPATRRLYDLLVDDDEHGCGDLPEEACCELPRNATRLVAALSLQKAGGLVVDPKTVLVWLLAAVGAPAGLSGLLVPVRESGALLPQASLVPWVRRFRLRKWLWVAGAMGQAAAVALLAITAATASGVAAGISILAALGGFALSRSLSSIAHKDVLGRTVPKGQRGQVTGFATVASGLVAITVGVAIRMVGGEEAQPAVFAGMLMAAALSWAAAAAVFATVAEPAGAPDDALATGWLRHAVDLLRSDAPFRRFVITRTLLLVSALSPPFVVALAARDAGASFGQLGPFVAASGLASLVGGPVWGRLSDRSSRRAMMLSAGTSAAIVALLLAVSGFGGLRTAGWLYPLGYLLLALSHTGARIGRKTYLVDLGEGNRRTDYVATANTAMGLLLLVTGGVSAALAGLGIEVALAFLAVLGAGGAVAARSLPEVTRRPWP